MGVFSKLAERGLSPDLKQLETRIAEHLRGRLRNFRFRIQAEGICLHGQANSYHVKQLAQHLAMKGTSLKILANEIEVV